MPSQTIDEPRTGELGAGDYERVLTVLGRVAGAGSSEAYRTTLVSALQDEFGIDHATSFHGHSLESTFFDHTPVAGSHRGRGGVEDYCRTGRGSTDVFATSAAIRRLRTEGVVTLGQLRPVPVASHDYIEKFYARWELASGTVMTFRPWRGEVAIVGLFDHRENPLSAIDRAALEVLRRYLPMVANPSGLAAMRTPPIALTARQREVAALVAEGLTNADIGNRLFLAEDTVKKYVSRLLGSTGSRTRTELALQVSAWFD